MAEPAPPAAAPSETPAAAGPSRSPDEVALELMKFIAVSTGYGRSTQSSTGFSGKPVARSTEEQIDALLELFERCRRTVKKDA
jgi:hypothetical protein